VLGGAELLVMIYGVDDRERLLTITTTTTTTTTTTATRYEEHVVQPLLVSLSAVTLATECVCMILKIDDVVPVR